VNGEIFSRDEAGVIAMSRTTNSDFGVNGWTMRRTVSSAQAGVSGNPANHAVPVTEIAFIDPAVTDVDALLAGLRPGIEGIVLNAAEPAPAQMARWLAGHDNLQAVHIIAHGAPGELHFATGSLSASNLSDHTLALARIGAALDADGSVRLWSCRTGFGAQGARFVAALETMLGAAVAASSRIVGAAALNGCWDLDISAHAGQNQLPLTYACMHTYPGVMAKAKPTSILVTDDVGTIQGALVNNGYTDDTNLTVRVNLPTSGIKAVAGDRVQLYNGTGTTDLLNTYTLTADDIINGYANVPTGTLTNGSTYVITARIANSSGSNQSLASSSITVTEDTTAPTVVPSIISVTDNVGPVTGTLSNGASTNDATLTVRVDLTGTDAVAGYTVQLYDGTGTTSLLGAYTLKAGDITNGYANVTTSTLIDSSTYAITARIADKAGNQTAASSPFTVTEDTTAPTGAPSITSVTDNVGTIQGSLANWCHHQRHHPDSARGPDRRRCCGRGHGATLQRHKPVEELHTHGHRHHQWFCRRHDQHPDQRQHLLHHRPDN
jgi:hypothetical protein